MKSFLFFIIFISSFCNHANACDLITQSQILINDINSTEEWRGLKTNCKISKLKSARVLLMRYEGEIPRINLKHELARVGIHFNSESKIIHIRNLSTHIKNLNFLKDKEIKIEGINNNVPNLSGSNLIISLEKPNIIKIRSPGTNQSQVKFNLSYKQKIECLVASANITPYSKQRGFKKSFRWLPHDEITNVFMSKDDLNNHLRHYKLSSFVEKNKTIKKSFFTKRNLLTFGKTTKVFYRDKNLLISTSGLPQSNGGINDSVMIKLSNNKIIQAYIIDKDKVSANL